MAARGFVWLGGALFVSALLLCAWWYLFVSGQPQRFGGAPALVADAALFGTFALHHSIFARDAVKRRLGSIPPDLHRSVYVYVASLLLIAVCVAWRPIGGEVFRTLAARGHAGKVWGLVRPAAGRDPESVVLLLAQVRRTARRVPAVAGRISLPPTAIE